MKPGKLDLPKIWRGLDWQPIIFKWKDADGQPFNLNGWQPYVQTRSGISLNPEVTNEAGGVTQISLSRTETKLFNLGVERWDWVWRNNGTADINYPPVLYGSIEIDQSQTRDFPP